MGLSSNPTIRKTSVLLAGILPLLFIADVLYGLLDYLGIDLAVTPGILIRGAVLVVAFYTFLTMRRYASPVLWWMTALILVSVVPSLLVSLFSSNDLVFDLSDLAKVLYFPVVTVMISIWLDKWGITGNRLLSYIEYSAYGLGISLLISQWLGVSRQTYGDYAYGNLGVFYAQNDMTLAFGMALLSSTYGLLFNRFSWFRFFMLLASGYACLQIGTRASLLVVAAAVLVPVVCLIRTFNVNKWASVFQVFRNIPLVFIFVGSLGVLLADALQQQEGYQFQQKKIEELSEGVHPRQLLIDAGIEHLSVRNSLFDLTGEGSANFQKALAERFDPQRENRMVEVDWIDLYGVYGLPLTLLLYLLLIWAILGAGMDFLIKGSTLQGLVAAALALYLGHGVLAGHALVSPIPSTLAAAYMALYFSRKKFMREA